MYNRRNDVAIPVMKRELKKNQTETGKNSFK
jgi:hypothetical protein